MRKIPCFSFTRERFLSGFDGKECKVYPHLVDTGENMFLTYQMLLLSGSDVFNDLYVVKSIDGGKTFGEPEKLRRIETKKDGIRRIFAPATEYYSKHRKKWITFGMTISYADDKHPVTENGISTGKAGYILHDEDGHYVGEVKAMELPFKCISACPHGQVIEYENGEFLISFYLVPAGETKAKVLTVRYKYENENLIMVKVGELLDCPESKRGFCEPSVAKLYDKYYVTLRTDEKGMFAVSDDGYKFSEPIAWRWDDGSEIGNYNTMQRWIRYKDALYLAYTRKGAHNDHVFRHRAPMFMARFDEEKMCIVKDTEVILVPELGARLGNFTVTDISENEFRLITAEWMQSLKGKLGECERYGSDNSIWIAKITFE